MIFTGLEILAYPCEQFNGRDREGNKEIANSACTYESAEFSILSKVRIMYKF